MPRTGDRPRRGDSELPGDAWSHLHAGVAQLIVRSALQRKESRGLHFTTDHPELDPAQSRDTVIKRGVSAHLRHA